MGIVSGILEKRKVTIEQLDFHKEDKLNFPELYNILNVLSTRFFMERGLKVGVLYDTDVDGLLSGYILKDFLERLGIEVEVFINPKKQHGLVTESMEWVQESQFDWLFVVDAGSNDSEQLRECLKLGTKVVVLDHHPYEEEEYEDGIWVVNISKYPGLPQISGCGVVYRFLELAGERFGIETRQYETYVGITIISDMCDMSTPENRYYVKKAYEGYRDSALLKKFKLYGSHRSFYGWSVNPYLNALIRVGEEKRAVEIVNNMDRFSLMNQVPRDVKRVKDKQKAMIEELKARGTLKSRPAISLHLRKNIDELGTLNGLVANQLLKEHGRGALVLAYDKKDKMWKGSYRGLHFEDKELEKWGFWTRGHGKACGVRINHTGLKKFHKEFTYDLGKEKEGADIYINSGDLTEEQWESIANFNEYTGIGMPEIVVGYRRGEDEILTSEEEYGMRVHYTKDGEIKDFTSGMGGDLRVVPIKKNRGFQLLRA